MVTDQFGTLLEEISREMKIGPLISDKNNTCQIRLKTGLEFQIEMDKAHQFLIIGADLGVIPPGRYRENILREALKANGLPHPLYGIFAYSKKKNSLILFMRLNLSELTGQKVAEFLQPFTEKGLAWMRAIARGEVPVVASIYTSGRSGMGMFGLRP